MHVRTFAVVTRIHFSCDFQVYSKSEEDVAAVAVPPAGTSGVQDATLSACMYVCLMCLCPCMWVHMFLTVRYLNG